MRLSETVELSVLSKYGFSLIDEAYLEEWGIDEYDFLYDAEGCYVLNLGHSRRGQFYYLLVYPSGSISIYASEPDGSGADVQLGSTLVQLINDKIFVE